MRFRYRYALSASVGILLLMCLVLGISALVLQRRVTYALAVTQQAQASIARRDLQASCTEITAAAAAWQSSAVISAPLEPMLHRLSWVPQIGGDLRIAPELIQAARHSSAAGATACAVLQPALGDGAATDRLRIIAERLGAQPTALTNIRTNISAAQQAWQAAAPYATTSPRLASYQAQLTQLDGMFTQALAALSATEAVAPRLPWLLGNDAPRRYLVVLQNPFELRPTGGFIGVVCVVRVARAQPSLEQCQPSEAFDAPMQAEMPFAYTHYLRLGNWYLRDANWSPDFPTTARTLQEFWALNKQTPVDGVIAVDPYALEPLLRVTGPLTLADGAQVDANNAVEALLARYYDGATYRNKSGLADLVPALLQQLQQTAPNALPSVAAAAQTALNERHIQIALNDQTGAAALAQQGWDGSLQARPIDTLRVVDADVGYGAVNAFVERLTAYDIALDAAGAPLTATLTLTYTNRYSPWAEANTSYAVNGLCTNPRTARVERELGCYADYVRVFVPAGSRLLGVAGLDQSLGVDQQYQRTIFGGYLLVKPGEQRIVQFRYRLPMLTPGRLIIEKQPGTQASPVLVTAHTGQQAATFWSVARTDLSLTLRANPNELIIAGPVDQSAAMAFTRSAALTAGFDQWQAGQRDAALQTWQAGGALDLALDQARRLAGQDPAGALRLVTSIATSTADGRAAFEQATLYEAQGKLDAADRLYIQAAQQSPDNALAQLTLARRMFATGQPLPAVSNLSPQAAAVRRWRATADELEQTDVLDAALAYVNVLLAITPNDHALALRQADLLLRAGQPEQAAERYARLAQASDVWGQLAGARQAQLAQQQAEAAAKYKAALPLANTYALAFRVGDGLRDLGAVSEALAAYQQAARLAPGSIWPLLAAGNMLRASDPAAARTLYERAQRIDAASGYPDFALGTLLLEQNNATAAWPFLQAAAAKQPEVILFRETLAQAAGKANSSSSLATRNP